MKSLISKILLINTFSLAMLSAQAATDWSYTGKTGPENWSGLDPSFSVCATGKDQTPINIQSAQVSKQARVPLKLDYAYANERTITNNGHTIQVGGHSSDTLTLNGVKYSLAQFHFHTPSENKVNGKSYAGEIHFVNQNADGGTAVIGVFITRGAENPALTDILAAAPHKVGTDKVSNIDLAKLIPQNSDYYAFSGSLTTPPCTEGLKWFIFANPITASAAQIKALEKILGHNARPIQNLNHRHIAEYQ